MYCSLPKSGVVTGLRNVGVMVSEQYILHLQTVAQTCLWERGMGNNTLCNTEFNSSDEVEVK